MTPGPLLLIAVLCLVFGIAVGPKSPRAWLTAMLIAATTGLAASFLILGSHSNWELHSSVLLGGERLYFRLDGISALFLALLSAAGGLGAIYAYDYWSDHH